MRLVSLLAALSLIGCKGTSDRVLDQPDAALTADSAPAVTQWDGLLTFRYAHYDTQLATAFGLPTGVQTTSQLGAYFLTNSSATIAQPMVGTCTDLTMTVTWPVAEPYPRSELDVGTLELRGFNAASASVTVPAAKQTGQNDFAGHPHSDYYAAVQANADNVMKPDSLYDVVFGGAGSVPATTITGGVFLPPTFTIMSPALENNGPLVAGTGYPVGWTQVTASDLPTGDVVQMMIWLADSNGTMTHLCMANYSAGTFTIPGAVITRFKAIAQSRGAPTNQAILLREAWVVQNRALPTSDAGHQRTADFAGVISWAQLMNVN